MLIWDFHLKVFEPFVFSVLLIETVMDVRETASIHTRCEFRSVPLIFEMIFVLGFVYWIERFETASDSHHSGFLWYWRKRWDGIRFLPVFLIGDSKRFFDSWLWSLPVSLFRSFLLLWSGSCEILHCFFPLLLWSTACDYARSALPPVACSRWIASTTVLWWRFTMNLWESLAVASNSFAFRLCLLL